MITVTLETITPDEALKILDTKANYQKQRHLRPTHVDFLISEMLKGNWQLTGETIKYGVNGELLDGQHRLHACARSKVPLKVFVARNVPEDAFLAIDLGLKRSISDILKI